MRLIDADAFIEYANRRLDLCADELILMIEEQPAAYDVEKVVECLEEKVELAHKRYVDCPVNSPCYERYRTQ